MKSAGESDSREVADGVDAPRGASGRRAALGCFVLAGAILALGLVLGSALMITSVVRNPADEPARPELRALVLNRCESPIRAGWVLSDTAAPFGSDDADSFFTPLRASLDGADAPVTENQTRLIAPGSSAPLDLGRPETATRERILLVQVISLDPERPDGRVGTGDSVLAYSLRPASFPLTDGAVPLVVLGEKCVVEDLEQASLWRN